MTTERTVVLARHGEAMSTSESFERPLTIVGRQHSERMASWLESSGYRVDEIVHSEKLRARQTAKIFGRRLGLHAAKVHEAPHLNPGDDPVHLADTIETDRRSVMVVGHLPFLARLASVLLVGDPNLLQIGFVEAGVVVLTRERGGWQVDAAANFNVV